MSQSKLSSYRYLISNQNTGHMGMQRSFRNAFPFSNYKTENAPGEKCYWYLRSHGERGLCSVHFSEDSWPEMKFCYAVNCLRNQAEDSLEIER